MKLPGELATLSELHPFSSIRLVALDIDGTLTAQPDDRVAAITRDLYRTLRTFGVTVTLATGRAFAGAAPLMDALFAGYRAPVILYNGALVADPGRGEVLRRVVAPPATVSEVVGAAAKHGFPTLAYDCVSGSEGGQQSLLSDGRGQGRLAESVTGWAATPGPALDYNGLPILWKHPARLDHATEAIAMLVVTGGASVDAEVLARDLDGVEGVSVTASSSNYLEVRPDGATKGASLRLLATSRSLSQEQVVAVGDNDNDVEMLRWSGIGVAVADASPRALAAADFQCRHGAAEGVVELLRLVAHARRYFRRASTGVPGA